MREYTVSGSGITVAAAAVILAFINPPAGRVIEITGASCSQHGSTTSAEQGMQVGVKATAFPTLTSATPAKTKTSDAVSFITGGTAGAAGTAGINASANGAGTETPIWSDGFNVLNNWIFNPLITLGQTLVISGQDAVGFYLKMTSTPGTAASLWDFNVTFREIG